ncbi:class I SAM-dependent methyltransferase [Nocardioides sp. cx-169]|uniref:class I SAM-dependent methyltransferase n=1 Tax=Nocardioides sp. cx-169 TaxID=2899080 RepID=UPI001E4CDCCF|nr:class I SAM-dependent methyltransferase [Nocardioides sp. cx-169]MCD4532537.1 class I SAM-dependent methyltransferase [Nocardioides sp. cx-169]
MPLTTPRLAAAALRRLRGARPAEPAPGPGRPERPAGPPSTAPAGSLRLDGGFTDRFPGFLDTSQTSSYPWRLNLRHEAIFTMNRQLFDGARVLDIASHDGRWSMAALDAGAAHVTGIEARPELVAHAGENLARYGVAADRFSFEAGDVFAFLAREGHEYDVVLCLGFLYHTLRHTELLGRARDTGARHLVVDTEVHRHPETIVRLATEPVEREGNAVPDGYAPGDTVITGRPTLSALELLGRSTGFELTRLADWDGLLRDNPDATQISDYRIGRRLTATFERR